MTAGSTSEQVISILREKSITQSLGLNISDFKENVAQVSTIKGEAIGIGSQRKALSH